MTDLTLEQCRHWDATDPLAPMRDHFTLPEGVIYLDGNSLGALPRHVAAALGDVIARQWGSDLIRSWNSADWITLPQRIGARIAPLIGANADEVIAADSVSVNIFKLAAAALRLAPDRRVILSEAGNFPTDLYVLQGLQEMLGDRVDLRVVPRDQIKGALGPDVALLLLTHVHYKTAEVTDMHGMTQAAHDAGALMMWDLSHSTGALPIDLNASHADFAVGCGYKYLNGGPGAPAFLYAARRHQAALSQPLSGWMGHRRPFDFVDDYEPAAGMDRHLCGTPPVLAMAALYHALEVFDGLDMTQIRHKSRKLGDLLIGLMRKRCPDFIPASPTNADERGSHVSFRHPDAYAICQALIDRGIIGDFRSPDILRLGLTPLYLRFEDIWLTVDALVDIMANNAHCDPRFQERAAVT